MKNELLLRIITSIIILPISLFLIFKGEIFFIIFLSIIGVILIKEWTSINNKKSLLINLIGFFYISISLISIYFLRGDNIYQFHIFIWILFICVFSDIGGYVVGKLVGGKKLTKLSPNKTISGSLGSYIFSFFPLLLFKFFIVNNDFFLINIKNIFLTLILSTTCQIGDLLISYYKRKNKVKNIGNFLPGHGGLFDRVDGIILTFLFASILNFFKFL